MWVDVYKANGPGALKPQKHEYSYADRKYAVEHLLAGDSQYQVMFSIGMTCAKPLREWLKKYEECGWIGLESKKREIFPYEKRNQPEKFHPIKECY